MEGDLGKAMWVNPLKPYKVKDQRLYRDTLRRKHNVIWEKRSQLVIPRKYRMQVLQMAHEIPMSSHLGINKGQSATTILLAQHGKRY